MHDAFQRNIDYLRISVTDRCNLRCIYCMPAEGVELSSYEDILRLEEIVKIIRSAVTLGIKKIRFTGGEPLVRKGITDLIKQTSEMPEIEDISMTTNGILLPEMAKSLKKAGLNRVNISLDTLSPQKFAQMTRGGQFGKVWLGIEAARDAGLGPVKLNTVVIRGMNDDEIFDFVDLTTKMPIHVRFIELMPIGASQFAAHDAYISSAELLHMIGSERQLVPENEITGSGPAKYFRIPGAPGTVGVISPISSHFCSSCNRVRLTAEGQLRPCLQSPREIDLRVPLRSGATERELAEIIQYAINSKPEKHDLAQTGWEGNRRVMNQIGG